MKSIKKQIKKITNISIAAYATSLVYMHDVSASAADTIKGGADNTGQSGGTSLEGGIEIVTNLLLFLIGVISVIAIIIGGIRYTTSNGDQGAVTSAKNTILYAVIGLVVAIMAYAIVRWVVNVFM